MKPVLTIQIPTYRNIKQLGDCLTTLLNYTEYPYRIVVINNDGTPEGMEAVDRLVARFPVDCLSVIHAGANLGWMAAHNLALKTCDTPLVCLMNDDVVFIPWVRDFWRQMTGFFQFANVGAVGPCSNFVMGTQNLWMHNAPPTFATTLLIGFCVVMRTEAIKGIGGLDETLPGGDDLDWSIRLRDAGWELIVNRMSYLHHIGQQTGRRVKSDWDSLESQDRTNNALIRKHGVKKWYECISAQILPMARAGANLDRENDWMQERLDRHKDAPGLSLGCGARDTGKYGLDMARKGDRGAGGRKFEGATPDVTANAMDIPMRNGSLDYIVASHLLEHLVDPFAALAEWARVLKPGGKLYITMPNHDVCPTIIIDYTHVHAYTPDTAEKLLTMAGFKVDWVEAFESSIAFGIEAHKPGEDE